MSNIFGKIEALDFIVREWKILLYNPGGGALDPKLGRHVRRAKKITGPLLVQASREILGKLTLISANLS